jgi:hypothetical protein
VIHPVILRAAFGRAWPVPVAIVIVIAGAGVCATIVSVVVNFVMDWFLGG